MIPLGIMFLILAVVGRFYMTEVSYSSDIKRDGNILLWLGIIMAAVCFYLVFFGQS